MSSSALGAEEGAAAVRRHPPAWLRHALRADIVVTGLFFAALTLLTFVGVIMRYFLNNPIVWLEEVQLALFLGVVYLGGGSAFRHGSHVAIDFVVERFPAGLRKVTALIVHAVVVAVLAYFAWQGAGLAASMADSGRVTSILRIPSVLIYSMIPIGLVWAIVNYLYTVIYGEEVASEEVHA